MFINSYFPTVVWSEEKPEFVKSLNKASNKYISDARKREKEFIKKNGDFGRSYHSTPLNGDPGLKEMEQYVGQTSYNLLEEWGYDMSLYTIFFTEFWVQEFAKNGGGHHSTHVHWDNHISGFYFLKCSDKISYPVFHDPRAGAMMTKLPHKDKNKISNMSDMIHIKPKPGTLIFFPAYVSHEFVVDMGVEPFRFIHFNLQAVRNTVVNTAKGMNNENNI